MAADEPVAGSRDGISGFFSAAGPCQSFGQLLVEASQALPDFVPPQGLNTVRPPGANVEILPALQVCPPYQVGLPLIRRTVGWTFEARHGDDIDRRDRFALHLPLDFVIPIDLPLFAAVRAAEILFGEDGQHQL